jgi:hypothetical protein
MDKCCAEEHTEGAFGAMLDRVLEIIDWSMEYLPEREFSWSDAFVGRHPATQYVYVVNIYSALYRKNNLYCKISRFLSSKRPYVLGLVGLMNILEYYIALWRKKTLTLYDQNRLYFCIFICYLSVLFKVITGK